MQYGFYTHSTSRFVPATLAVLGSYMWLVAAILDGACLGARVSKLIHVPPWDAGHNEASPLYPGNTEREHFWELLPKSFQGRRLLSWDLIAPRWEGHPWQR